jgi:tetratricopeptide (TPR) repeat protein
VCHAHWATGAVHLTHGDLGEAIPVLERGLEHARTWRIELLLPQLRSNLGYTYALSGRLSEGLALLEPGALHPQPVYAHMLAWLAEAYLLDGRLADAARIADQAVEVTRTYQQRGFEANALRMVAEVATRADRPKAKQADSYYHQSLALAEELGMRPLVAHCHLGLGTLYQKVGRDEQARAELTSAAEMYRAMEMMFWLEKAEAAQAQVPR